MQSTSASGQFFRDATAPPPSEPSGNSTDDSTIVVSNVSLPPESFARNATTTHTMQSSSTLGQGFNNDSTTSPSGTSVNALEESALVASRYREDIRRLAQEAFRLIVGEHIGEGTPQKLVTASQYRNKFGITVKSSLELVLKDLDQNNSQLRIVISQNDTLSSIKKQISNHKAIFERTGYPAWSKDILGFERGYNDHSWCQLVFRGALASTAQSMGSDCMRLFTCYTKVQRWLDSGAIEDLRDYIRVHTSLNQIYERVEKYSLCSTEYQLTIKSGSKGLDRHTFTTGPEGCRMSAAGANVFEAKERPIAEQVVWPPPASGFNLSRSAQIVELKVARAVASSKFREMHLKDVEGLGLHKLEERDLKLFLNTKRFANAAQLRELKVDLSNHVTDGSMSNLAREWLLGDAGNETSFKHLLLLPDKTGSELVRVMKAAVDLGTENEVRKLCWQISGKEEVWDCCEAIARVSAPSGNVARGRLCLACLEPAAFGAVRRAVVMYRKGAVGRGQDGADQTSEELRIMLKFAETDALHLKVKAYQHLKEIGSTSHAAARHAEQISSEAEAEKLANLTRCLKHPDRTSVDLVRMMMDATKFYREDEVQQLCEEIFGKKEVWDCCDAIARVSTPVGIAARLRLCMACRESGVLSAVWRAAHGRSDGDQTWEELKIMLKFAETDGWKLKLKAYHHLKEIGSTNHAAARHAERISSEAEAEKLANLTRCLKHPDRTSVDLVRMMMDATKFYREDEVQQLCEEIFGKKEVWDCCDAIARVSAPSSTTAKLRLCMTCLEPAVFGSVLNATRMCRKGAASRRRGDNDRNCEELKIMLRLAATDAWKLKLTAYHDLKEMGSTNHVAVRHAEQIRSETDAQKLKAVIGHLQRSTMRNHIVNASGTLSDLEVYVRMVIDGWVAETSRAEPLLRRLLEMVGYRSVGRAHVSIESGLEREELKEWMSSGPSGGVCLFGEIFVLNSGQNEDSAPPKDEELLRTLTGTARRVADGRLEFFQGYDTKKSNSTSYVWLVPISTESTSDKVPVWKQLRELETSVGHISEQIYFYAEENGLPDAGGLSLVKAGGDGTADLIGRGLTITPRIAEDIWDLGGKMYYSVRRARVWKLETEGSFNYAGQVSSAVGRFIQMRKSDLLHMTIS